MDYSTNNYSTKIVGQAQNLYSAWVLFGYTAKLKFFGLLAVNQAKQHFFRNYNGSLNCIKKTGIFYQKY